MKNTDSGSSNVRTAGKERGSGTTQSERADRLFILAALITSGLFIFIVVYGWLEFSSRRDPTPTLQPAFIPEARAERSLITTLRAERGATAAAIGTEVGIGSTASGISRATPCADGSSPSVGTPCPVTPTMSSTPSPFPSATAPSVGTPAR